MLKILICFLYQFLKKNIEIFMTLRPIYNKLMSSNTNINDNTTYTICIPEIENSAKEELIKQIKQRIFTKKLNGFKLVDYSIEPPKLPVLKPTLNSHEIKLILSETQPGELNFGKCTPFSKVMIYKDEHGVGWEVAAYTNNSIIDVEMCRVTYETDETNQNKISCQISDILSSVYENDSFTYPNVYNNTESREYKMVLTAVLKGVCSDQTVNSVLDPELVSEILEKVHVLTSWKVIIVKSVDNQSHVFVTKDTSGNIWAVETDWAMNQVISTFHLVSTK